MALPYVASTINIGHIIGGLSSGLISAKLGRRAAFIISSVVASSGWALMAVYPHLACVIVGRFLVGAGSAIDWALYTVYLSELVSLRYREFIMAVGNNVCFNSGVLLSGILGGYLNWSVVCWIYACLFACHSIAMLLVPESPSWLYANAKYEAAAKALTRMQRGEEIEELEKQARRVRLVHIF